MKAAIAGVGRRDDTIVALLEWSLCRLVRRDIKCHLGGSAGGPLSDAGLFDLYTKLLIFVGERAGARTRDPLIKSQMLYRLSYALACRGRVFWVGCAVMRRLAPNRRRRVGPPLRAGRQGPNSGAPVPFHARRVNPGVGDVSNGVSPSLRRRTSPVPVDCRAGDVKKRLGPSRRRWSNGQDCPMIWVEEINRRAQKARTTAERA